MGRRIAAAVLTLAVGAAAAGGASGAKPRPARCTAGKVLQVGTDRVAYSATVVGKATVFRAPTWQALGTFPGRNANGFPTTFLVDGAIVSSTCAPLWYRVELAVRPNGTQGFVRPAQVELARVDTRIVVSLSGRRLTLYRAGREVLHTTVAVGKPSTPTPTGRFFVNQRLVPANPNGAYGPAALGISAFSPVLTSWVQGGPIGIHGTDEPQLLGQAATHGCVRVENATMKRLFALAPAGTPVLVGR